MQDIKDKDVAVRTSTNCETAGCSSGTRYVCCVPAASEPTSAATYLADGWMGGLDPLTVNKVGTECARLDLARPQTSRPEYRIENNDRWALSAASFGTCTDAAVPAFVKGALGTVNLRKEGNGCVADVHVTLFDFSATGEMKTTRLDVDGLAIGGMGVSCRQP